MLSNTATPKYYGEFRARVLAGEIPVCEEISLEMNRIDRLIADPKYYYDDKAVEGYVAYCESELTLTDGSNLRLLDTFKLWAEEIFGWYYFVTRSVYVPDQNGHGGHFEQKRIKKRLTLKQYLIVGRGAAKSMYGSTIQAYGLVVDKSTTDQITTAPTMEQANEILSPLKTAITRARGPLFKFLTLGSIHNTTGNRANRCMLTSTKKGIENFLTASILRIRPMKIDKLQGLRCKYATVDEWLSGDIREDPMAAIEQGASKNHSGMPNDDYIIVAMSSEGTVRNGPGDQIKMELEDILHGKYQADHISIWYYKLDDIKEVSDIRMWVKAQPNIGTTVSYETYQLEVARAENSPAVRNEILAKRFGIPLEGYTYFFPYAETLVHPRRQYFGMSCSLGADLSQGDDFCAFTFMFPLGGYPGFGIKVLSYISSRTYHLLPPAKQYQYQTFMEEGSLRVLEGSVLDMAQVYDDLDAYIAENRYNVNCLGYDPYNSKVFIELWTRDNGDYGVEKVIQGRKTESVPLGEIKVLSEDRLLFFDQLLMQYAMGNAIVDQDINGNRMLVKKRYEDKIDNVSALMDAYIAYTLHKEEF